MSINRNYEKDFVRTFFTSPTAVEGHDDTAKLLRSAAQLRGMKAPDTWIPDNEDATAPSMRDEGVSNIVKVVSEYGEEFPGEIHPRVVWHRDDPAKRHQGFQQMLEIANPDNEAIEYIDGFVIPEVGDIDDWKKADEFLTIVETEHNLKAGSLSMSVIVESGEAELAMGDLRSEMGAPSNQLERLFMLVDGEVDYTKDMRAMTPTGTLPDWPELRHNTSRGASAAGLIAVDGPFDDIRDVAGYHERMNENRAKGMTGIWSLTPGQVVEANEAPLPPKTGEWLLELDDETVELDPVDRGYEYTGDDLSLESTSDDQYRLQVNGITRTVDQSELEEALIDMTAYVSGLDDMVDSMEEFEAAKAAGKGAIAMTRSVTIVIDDVSVSISKERMWDEATYQAATTPISLFQDVYEHRPDQHEELVEMYGADIVGRAMSVGTDD